jgi:predicted nucleic acid-binding protein
VTLIDTSAWVDFLRAAETPAHHAIRDLIDSDQDGSTTDVVVMEVLAGARDADHHGRLRRMLARCELVPVVGLADYEEAAALYQRCRRAGATVRALTDCLIAAVALRADLQVLHADRDFEVLAEHTGLRTIRGD